MEKNKNCFASDNYAGVCPEAWESLAKANDSFEISYGDDDWTAKACKEIRKLFETDCEIFFVFNGTAANSLALASLCQSYHSIICQEVAHIETDECGAPEFFSNGTKSLLVPGVEGKIDLTAVEKAITKRSDIHYPKPKVISVTQVTELGTVYTVDELRAIGELAQRYSLKVHMDGARFANAVAALNVAPKELTWKAGVDVLCFGGIKNGIPVGEAVIFFNKALAYEFDYRCKQAGQLASKMRFLSAPWIGMLESGAWLKNAAHANKCARLLYDKLSKLKGVKVLFPQQANSVFIELSPAVIEKIRACGWHFYTFIGSGGARLMCSWATKEEDVESFVEDLKAVS
ncbi:MAG: low specificity L-threonine aldolase [Deltaproteobacteria bacterium]|nr:low specificity L-threonine aldolase [Deltaproteobacteria bacterium]